MLGFIWLRAMRVERRGNIRCIYVAAGMKQRVVLAHGHVAAGAGNADLIREHLVLPRFRVLPEV